MLGAFDTDDASIKIVVNSLKDYIKKLAKDKTGLDDKQVKKLEKLGFTFADGVIGFTFIASCKAKTPAKKPEAIEPEVVEDAKPTEDAKPVENVSIDTVIDEVVNKDEAAALEALADEMENEDDENGQTETPVGDTYTDDNVVDNQPTDFGDEEDEDDTIDDARDENDDDKVDFRRDWNNEFGDDGERNENW